MQRRRTGSLPPDRGASFSTKAYFDGVQDRLSDEGSRPREMGDMYSAQWRCRYVGRVADAVIGPHPDHQYLGRIWLGDALRAHPGLSSKGVRRLSQRIL